MSALSFDIQPPSSVDIRALRLRLNGDLVLPGDPEWDDRAPGVEPRRRPAPLRGRARRVRRGRRRRRRASPASTGCASRRRAPATAPRRSGPRGRDPRQDRAHARASRSTPRRAARASRPAPSGQDVVEPAAEQGFVVLHGSSPDVGVVGYTLGGGMGWLARSRGLAANSVAAVEVVTADGRLVRADRDNEPDLFWAVRGGGGSFGVVTAIEIELYPAPELYAGWLFFPIERAQRGAARLARVGRDRARRGHVARADPAPAADPGHPRAAARQAASCVVEAVFTGSEERGRRAARAAARARAGDGHLRARSRRRRSPHLHMDPPQPGARHRRRHVPRRADGRGRRRDRRGRACRRCSRSRSATSAARSPAARRHGAVGSIDAALRDVRGRHRADPGDRRGGRTQAVDRAKAALAPWESRARCTSTSPSARSRPTGSTRPRPTAGCAASRREYDAGELFVANHPIPPAR